MHKFMSYHTELLIVRVCLKGFVVIIRLMGRIYFVCRSEQIGRWRDSVKQLRMTIPFIDEELIEGINSTIIANKLESCYIRRLSSFGYGASIWLSSRYSDCYVVMGKLSRERGKIKRY